MKSTILIYFSMLLSTCVYAQTGISIGYHPSQEILFKEPITSAQSRYNFSPISITLEVLNVNSDKLFFTEAEFTFLPNSSLSISEFSDNIVPEKYFAFNLYGLGFLINKGKRIQFPILVTAGWESLTAENIKNQGLRGGLRGGLKIFLNNNIFIQGMYEYHNTYSFSEKRSIMSNTGIKVSLGTVLYKDKDKIEENLLLPRIY